MRHLQASFNGAQISRRLHARTDLGIHSVSVAEMTNMVATIEGAAIKRPGTRYRAAALASAARLTEFIFNATQAYVLEWSEGKVRFVTNGALVLDGADPLEVAVPYAAADVARLSYEQSGDVLYLAHGDYPHATLSRTAADAFTYAELELAGGPFSDPNGDEAVQVAVTGALDRGGAVTVTANAPIFAAGHVGSRFRVEAKDFGDVKAWQEGIDGIAIGDLRRSEGRVYRAASAGRTGYSQPIHDTGSEWDGDATGTDINEKGPYGVLWTYVHDRFGIVKIAEFTDVQHVNGVVERAVPTSLAVTPSELWAHGLFSDAAGWPEHVWLWRGRLWFIKDFVLAGSVAGDYRDFNEYAADGSRQGAQAIRCRLDITDKVLWVRADRQAIVLGTSRGEYAITPINPSEGISSENLQVSRQRRHGSARVWPIDAGGEMFFVQRGGRKVRASSYSFADDRYQARWANIYARHASAGGILELAYQAEPEELLYALRGDGTLAAHPYSPEQDVKGWSTALAMTGAAVHSMVTIPSPDAATDELWMLVERDGVRSLEQLGEWWDDEAGGDQADAYFLDSGLTYRGDPVTHIAGLEHLAERQVTVLADGAEISLQVAPDGSFDLETPASTIHAGIPFTARLELLLPDLQQRDGSSAGRLRRTVRIAANLIDGVSAMVGQVGGKLERIVRWVMGEPAAAAPPLFTGWTEPKQAGGSKDRNGRDVIEDSSPYPLSIPAIAREFEIE